MDLRLFHPTGNQDRDFKTLDRFTSKTDFLSCRLLEWSGWYTYSIPLRLLGHFRLYQLYKNNRFKYPESVHPAMGYIIQYRANYMIKYRWYMLISRFPSMFKYFDTGVEMHAINKMLINQRIEVLVEFLTNAEVDFDKALKHALLRIRDREFFNIVTINTTQQANLFVKLEQHTISNSHNELNIHPIVEKQTIIQQETIVKESAKDLTGKEKDVFSKRQILILFDLFAQSAKKDGLDLRKVQKHPDIARFLQAVTGKGKDTWMEMLQNYRDNDLYAFNSPTERSNLVGNLTNIANVTRNAGLRSITSLAEKQIKKLSP
jgi:hypothetical protein